MDGTSGATPPVRVWVATLVQADLAWRRWLDDRELDRFSRFESPADQARFLLGAAMLRSAVGNELGIPPREVPVDRTCASCSRWHGRPRVPHTALELSVTHSGLVVVLALARGVPVGIDVEPVHDDRAGMTESWTRAEARLKAGGDPDLVVYSLPAPLPGYVLSIATEEDTAVQVRACAELLAGGHGADLPTSRNDPPPTSPDPGPRTTLAG